MDSRFSFLLLTFSVLILFTNAAKNDQPINRKQNDAAINQVSDNEDPCDVNEDLCVPFNRKQKGPAKNPVIVVTTDYNKDLCDDNDDLCDDNEDLGIPFDRTQEGPAKNQCEPEEKLMTLESTTVSGGLVRSTDRGPRFCVAANLLRNDPLAEDRRKQELISLQGRIHLILFSGSTSELVAERLLRVRLKFDQQTEICSALINKCKQAIGYNNFYAVLAQTLCTKKPIYKKYLANSFNEEYTQKYMDTSELRNIASFFAELLAADVLPWRVLADIKLTEDENTSFKRVFIKTLLLEIAHRQGFKWLGETLSEPGFSYAKALFRQVQEQQKKELAAAKKEPQRAFRHQKLEKLWSSSSSAGT